MRLSARLQSSCHCHPCCVTSPANCQLFTVAPGPDSTRELRPGESGPDRPSEAPLPRRGLQGQEHIPLSPLGLPPAPSFSAKLNQCIKRLCCTLALQMFWRSLGRGVGGVEDTKEEPEYSKCHTRPGGVHGVAVFTSQVGLLPKHKGR